MPIDQVLKLVGGLELDSTNINTWKNGVERALKKYIPNGTEASGREVPALRMRDPDISGRMPDMHVVRHVQMRIVPVFP